MHLLSVSTDKIFQYIITEVKCSGFSFEFQQICSVFGPLTIFSPFLLSFILSSFCGPEIYSAQAEGYRQSYGRHLAMTFKGSKRLWEDLFLFLQSTSSGSFGNGPLPIPPDSVHRHSNSEMQTVLEVSGIWREIL